MKIFEIISWAIDLLVVVFALACNLNIIINNIIKGQELSTIEAYIAAILFAFALYILGDRKWKRK